MVETVEVRLLTKVRNEVVVYHAGETASFPAFQAEDLVRRGVAVWVSGPVRVDAAGLPPEYVEEVMQKELSAPPSDKMLDGRKTKKK